METLRCLGEKLVCHGDMEESVTTPELQENVFKRTVIVYFLHQLLTCGGVKDNGRVALICRAHVAMTPSFFVPCAMRADRARAGAAADEGHAG